jgi:predicted lipoprotein with Yx(FWY)xxD motif
MKIAILPILVVLAAGTIVACGGSDNSSGTSSTSSTNTNTGGGGAYSAPKSTPAASGAVSIKTGTGDPGTFLVDNSGRALYLWEADKGSTSTCTGACAAAWPPLVTAGMPKAGSGVQANLLGTTKRNDGKTEVTYKGHPLYYFAGDSAPGETKGQGTTGFGAGWYVVGPNGNKIEKGESH